MSLRSQRDKDNFVELYNETYTKLIGLAYRILHNQDDSEEIVHDVYVKLADDYKRYKNKSTRELTSLAVVMTRNACINLSRKKERRGEVLVDIKEYMLDCNESVQDQYFGKNKAKDIREAIGQLKMLDRDILILRYYHDMSYAEIARVLSIKPKTVETKLKRAKQRLGEVLNNEDGE